MEAADDKVMINLAMQIHEPPEAPASPPESPLRKIYMVASIGAGIQCNWALQFSLLTPYVQLFGIQHKWASIIWLCGPISGLVVEPVVGYYSDNCTSKFGRRRPFLAAGAAFVAMAALLISFAADIGHALGDSLGKSVTKPRGIVVFVFGFWVLDVANNMLQAPCRALLADLSGGNSSKMRTGNAFYAFFAGAGSILGYAAGSYSRLHKIFPFTATQACDVNCANLKSCFFLSITLLLTITILALTLVNEGVHNPHLDSDDPSASVVQESEKSNGGVKESISIGGIFGAMKDLPKPMRILWFVTFLNILAWFPFMLYDTDWMGREVYGGKVREEGRLYDQGVRAGSLGLMIQAIVLAITSLGIEFLARRLGGVKKLWGAANLFLAICMASTVLITKLAESTRRYAVAVDGGTTPLAPAPGIKAGTLALFGILGIPLAVTFSIPFALTSIYSCKSGAGQGLSLGVLNLSFVTPQLIVSVLSGPWDALFGGGNLPGFVVGAVAAAASGIFALTLLPFPPTDHAPFPNTK